MYFSRCQLYLDIRKFKYIHALLFYKIVSVCIQRAPFHETGTKNAK